MPDYDAIADAVSKNLRDYIDAQIRPVVERVSEIEARPPPPVITDAIKSEAGVLMIAMSDGHLIDTGIKDGVASQVDVAALIDELKQPPIDNISAKLSGRVLSLAFTSCGETQNVDVDFPVMIDRGVYSDGEKYLHCDVVTHNGSMFIAQRDTTDRPETSDAWRLAVKRGRDGKDAKVVEKSHSSGLPSKPDDKKED